MTWVGFALICGAVIITAICSVVAYKIAFFIGKWKEKENGIHTMKEEMSNMQKSIFKIKADVQTLSQRNSG